MAGVNNAAKDMRCAMRRDMDLVRTLLLAIEHAAGPEGDLDIRGYDDHHDVIGYHIDILAQAGLIRGPERHRAGTAHAGYMLTWAGHEFLANARDIGRWKRVQTVAGTVGDLSFDVMQSLLATLASEAAKQAFRSVVL
jgi:hypothetical protein